MKIDREFCRERIAVTLIGILTAVLLFWGACHVFYRGTVYVFVKDRDSSKQFREALRKVERDIRNRGKYPGTELSDAELDRILRMQK